MRNLLLSIAALLTLVACGADGPPERPTATPSGLTISGSAKAGIARDGG